MLINADDKVDQKLLSMVGKMSGELHFQVARPVVITLVMERRMTTLKTVSVSARKSLKKRHRAAESSCSRFHQDEGYLE